MKKWSLVFRNSTTGKAKTLYITNAKEDATDTELQDFMDACVGVIIPNGYVKDSAKLVDTTVTEKFDLIQ